ncbi:MAG: ATP synthase subunit I, partial [Deltaproteobacteria bacterium]|nr:ATP synthase subunit I [Deltaproteobacteria bacterium]
MNTAWTLSRIDSIERINLYVAGVLCAGSLLFRSLSVTIGVALGAFIVAANFWWLRRLVERAMAKGEGRKKSLYGQYVLKLLLFLVLPCAIVYYREYLFN